jgi:hypothetical protein
LTFNYASLSQGKINNGVAAIEDMASKGDSSNGTLVTPLPVDLVQLFLNKDLPVENGYYIESAQKEYPINSLKAIISTIRSKLLDFILEVGKQIGNSPITDQVKKSVEGIFTATITGNNNVFLVGDRNVQKVSININKHDFNQLANYFESKGLMESDIQELQSIIDFEEPDIEKKKFGSKVNNWIAKMVGKAATGGWDIAIGAAGSLLAEAIGKYYGWS